MSRDPWFKFYPTDWDSDTKLQSCSLEAQGFLVKLMCMMHQSSRPGYLLINGAIPPMTTVITHSRLHYKTFHKNLKELLDKGVIVEDKGALCCPRMVRDQDIRQKRKEAGRLGGNPALLNQKVNTEVNPRNQKLETRKRHTTSVSVFSLPDFLPKQTWELFIAHRKQIKHPITEKAYSSFVEKFRKLHEKGWPPDRVVDVMIEKGWRWFRPEWVQEPPPAKKAVDLVGQERRAMQQDREQNRDEYLDPKQVAEITRKLGLDFGKGRATT